MVLVSRPVWTRQLVELTSGGADFAVDGSPVTAAEW
jgi:hypothetical protein